VGDAFVTINAGFLARRKIFLVLSERALALPGNVHIDKVMAVPAFKKIV